MSEQCKMKPTVLIVNNIFGGTHAENDGHLLIIKSEGSRSVQWFDNPISRLDLEESLRTHIHEPKLTIEDCDIVKVNKNWRGQVEAELI